MKVYLAIKYHQDNSNRELIMQVLHELESVGIETISIMRDFEQWGKVQYTPQELMKLCFDKIDHCDAIIIEFSEKGVGLGIEAGYSFAKGIPIYAIAKIGADISTTLQGLTKNIYFYEKMAELKEIFDKMKGI